jgi:hypothetical protein
VEEPWPIQTNETETNVTEDIDEPDDEDPIVEEPDEDPEETDKEDKSSSNMCFYKDCNDQNSCTFDYCDEGVCKHMPLSGCVAEEQPKEQKPKEIQSTPEKTYDPSKILLNEEEGISFSIQTNKKEYKAGENVWLEIDSPKTDVELFFQYNGINQYIKIPKEKGFPLTYLLPLPSNLEEGTYIIKASTYTKDIVLKTNTYFKIGSSINNPVFVSDQKNIFTTETVEKETFYEPNVQEVNPKPIDENKETKPIETTETKTLTEETLKKTTKNKDIVLGAPVKWEKEIKVQGQQGEVEITVTIPQSANNIVVKDKENGYEIFSQKQGKDLLILDYVSQEEKEYVIEFETESPESKEQIEKKDKEWQKKIVIQSDEDKHGEYQYKDVLSYTDIVETEKEKIRLYWNVDGKKVDVTNDPQIGLQFHDTNKNSLIDMISWITPHLSTQEFEVVVTLTPSSGTGMQVNLIEPNNKYYNSASDIDFRFLTQYNKSNSLECNLTIDDTIYKTITVVGGIETTITDNFSIEEGIREWNVACSDDQGNYGQGDEKQFTIDLTAPTVEIQNPDPDLSLTDTITLEFIAEDNLANTLSCDVYIDGSIQQSTTVQDNTVKEITFSGLSNGTYNWNVICEDDAQNQNSSNTKEFNVDTERDFLIKPSKYLYDLGENGIYTIEAPYTSDVSLVIIKPDSTTIRRDYQDNYPVIDEIDFTNKPGIYTIQGFLNYKGAIKEINTSFQVRNTIDAIIEVTDNKVVKNQEITFKASSSGGIGDRSYSWNFDDGTTVAGKEIKHKFDSLGTYNVKLTVTDSQSNKVNKTQLITVANKYSVNIKAVDEVTGEALDRTTMILDGDAERISGTDGKAVFSIFSGKYDVFVRNPDYYSRLITIDVPDTINTTVKLEKAHWAYESDEELNERESIIKQVTSQKEEENEPESQEEKEQIIISSDDKYGEKELLVKILNALDDLESLDENQERIAEILRVRDSLSKAKVNMQRVERDYHNIESNKDSLSQSEIQDREKRIKDNIANTKENTILDIEVTSFEDIQMSLSDSEMEEIALNYLEIKDADWKSKKKAYLKDSIENQPISFNTKVYVVKLSYLSGDSKTITLLEHIINSEEDLKTKKLVVSMPESFISSETKLETESKYEILENNQIEFQKANQEIDYYISKEIDASKIKELKVAVLSEPRTFKKTGGSFTGFAIFSKIQEIENPIAVIEVIAIIILLLVYVFYKFDLFDKIKETFLYRGKEYEEIRNLMKDLKICLENRETENGAIVYADIMNSYKKLPANRKKSIHKEIMNLYHELVLAQINDTINITLAHLKYSDKKQAEEQYSKIMHLYKEIPKEHKAKVSERCQIVYKKITQMPDKAQE